MNKLSNTALAEPWRNLWNGDLSQLDKIVSEDFVAHASLAGGKSDDTLVGRAAIGEWISGMHSVMDGLRFDIEVGPIADADYLVLRWRTNGTYRGGIPGVADAAIGRAITFTGIDILRVQDGLLAEYWVNSDTTLLMQQLGVG